jgi:MSHA biogenesis protein MshE
MRRRNLGDMLLAANLIDRVQMKIALSEQKRTGKRFGSTLIELQFIDENVLAAFLSKQIDIPCISLLHIDIPRKVIRKLTRAVAMDCKAIPVRIEGPNLEVAMVDPTDVDLLTRIEESAKMPVIPLIAPESSIIEVINKFYPEQVQQGEDTLSGKDQSARNVAADPIFWDLVEEFESGDLDQRLRKIEQNLDRIWTLLEKVLRALEIREEVKR